MANLNKALGTDLASLAKLLRSKGRGKDSVLAHITPQEAALLKRRGGRGSINPYTGLPEFDDEPSPDVVPVEQAPAPVAQPAPSSASSDNAPIASDTNLTPSDSTASPQTTTFDPNNYGSVFGGGSSYQGDPSLPTSQIASGAPSAAAFGTTGGATIDPNQPLPVSLLGTSDPNAGNASVSLPTTDQTNPKGNLSNQLSSAFGDLGNLAKLGLAGGLGAFGASQARKTAGQIQAAQGQEQAIATPYQQQGQTLINQAQAGQLSPASQQAYAAAKAQLNQQAANRGGVGVQQAANQEAQIYQTLLNNQYTYGLNVMQIGDNIALGAIKTGLQLDQQLNTATTNFYGQLAQMLGGSSGGFSSTQNRIAGT